MYKFLSEIVNPKQSPDTLILDSIDVKCKNQLTTCITMTLEEMKGFSFDQDERSTFIKSIYDIYRFDKGAPKAYPINYERATYDMLEKINAEDFIDYIGFYFDMLYNVKRNIYDKYENLVNDILKTNYMGYKLILGKLTPIFDEDIADNVLKPCKNMLTIYKLDQANEHWNNSFEAYRKKQNLEAIHQIHMALESTIYSCLDKLKINYDEKDKVPVKLKLLIDGLKLPTYYQEYEKSLRGLINFNNVIRNNEAGHGKNKESCVDNAVCKFEINSVATAILFLVEKTFNSKQKTN